MRRILFVFCCTFLLSILITIAPLASSQETLVLGITDEFKPYSWLENGEMKGIDTDITLELCKRANITCQIQFMPWKRVQNLVEIGELDGAIAAFKTPEREEYAVFLDLPVHYTRQSIFVRQNARFNFQGIADLYGKRVGINRGFKVSSEFDSAAAERAFFLDESDTIEVALLKLSSGRIDAVVASQLQTQIAISQLNLEGDITELDKPITSPRPSYIMLSKRSAVTQNDMLINKLNSSLQLMYDDDTVGGIARYYIRLLASYEN